MLQPVLFCGDGPLLLGRDSRHVAPGRETCSEDGAVVAAREAMPPRTEVFSDQAERFQKPLRLRRRLEPSHRPFPLSRWLVGVLSH
jgi:hypothetical protein